MKPATNARVRSAVGEIVRKEAELGVDTVSDGEMSKPSFLNYITGRSAHSMRRPIPGRTSPAAPILIKHGIGARVEGSEALATANIFRLETTGVQVVCVSFLDARSPAQMRYTIRRLRRKLPDAKIVLGCWMAEADTALAETVKADAITTTLRDTVNLCLDLARSQPPKLSNAPTTIKLAKVVAS
jgi:hypothetical protein